MKPLSKKQLLTTIVILLSPILSMAQADPRGAATPDAVPFSNYANLVFMGIGLIFGVVIFEKNFVKKATIQVRLICYVKLF